MARAAWQRRYQEEGLGRAAGLPALGKRWKRNEKQLPGNRVQIDVKFIDPPERPQVPASQPSPRYRPDPEDTAARRSPSMARRRGSPHWDGTRRGG